MQRKWLHLINNPKTLDVMFTSFLNVNDRVLYITCIEVSIASLICEMNWSLDILEHRTYPKASTINLRLWLRPHDVIYSTGKRVKSEVMITILERFVICWKCFVPYIK